MSTVFRHSSRPTFYRRVHIPRKLRQHFKGRVEVWRSLRTADQDEASARSAQFEAQTKRLFVTLKKYGDRMTNEERDILVSHWLESELDYAEDCRVLAGPISDQQRDDYVACPDIMSDEAHEALLGNDYRKIEKEADALLMAGLVDVRKWPMEKLVSQLVVTVIATTS
ncbi:protein of unknown function [Nitrospira japonica]|uniref:DUF6538 domain-containing protein n=1 Tax=Nitrospira japonica TaxID=1325564 RepID=A0A1W1I0F4_9BACT|nr:DUF6538 domain-containing protein [Nitrospira japonica]SLM46471.1 protein of unknown function [Nitrospira japonica]